MNNHLMLPILLVGLASSINCKAQTTMLPFYMARPSSLTSSYSSRHLLASIRHIVQAGDLRWNEVLKDVFGSGQSVAPIRVRIPWPSPKEQLRPGFQRLESTLKGGHRPAIGDVGISQKKIQKPKEGVVADAKNEKSLLNKKLLKEVGDYLNKVEKASIQAVDRASTVTEVPEARSAFSTDEPLPSPNPIAGLSEILQEEVRKLKIKEPKKSSEEELKDMVGELKTSLTDLVRIVDLIIETGTVEKSLVDHVDEVVPEVLLVADEIALLVGVKEQ